MAFRLPFLRKRSAWVSSSGTRTVVLTNPEPGHGDMVNYCFKWNYADGTPGEPLTEAEARVKDGAGEEYTAIMPSRPGAKSPTLVTPVWKTGVVVVTFQDDAGRKSTEYTF